MKHWIVIGICLLLTATTTAAIKKPSHKDCNKLKIRIDNINAQLRQPYNVTKGEKLKAKLRQLKKLRYQCKKYRIPIK